MIFERKKILQRLYLQEPSLVFLNWSQRSFDRVVCVLESPLHLCVTVVHLAHSWSVCQSVCRVRGQARCIWNLWADGRRALLSHRCFTWLIDVGLFEVLSGRMSSIHKLLQSSHHSLPSLCSVNSWNATLLRAHAGMKLRWTQSNMIDSLRTFSIYDELQPVVALFPGSLIWIYCAESKNTTISDHSYLWHSPVDLWIGHLTVIYIPWQTYQIFLLLIHSPIIILFSLHW